MTIATFSAGAMVEFQGRTYELLRKLADDIWQLRDVRNERISEFAEGQLRLHYVEGELRFNAERLSRQVATAANTTDMSSEEWEIAKVRLLYVRAVETHPRTARHLAPLIQDVWERTTLPASCPSTRTVIRWLDRYVRSGGVTASLLDYDKSKGNKNMRFPPEVEQLVQECIGRVYKTKERRTIQCTVDSAKAEVIAANKLRPRDAPLPLPSRRLVQRMISHIDAYELCASRYGKEAARRRFRTVHHAGGFTNAPLERVEMDHTLLDLMVIDDRDWLPLGRPWLSVAIDDYTRNCVSAVLSFEPPSYQTVAQCLREALLPKVRLAAEYPEIKNTWDAHGIMRTLVVDNGMEFHSKSLENACFSLGIIIDTAARKTPWYKGKVERYIGTLNRAIAHGTPGTTFSNIFEKGDYDPSKHATIRLSVLKKILKKWIVDVYHQQEHSALETSPALMWSSSIKPEDIRVPADVKRLDAILGRSDTKTLTHKGFELDHLWYNSPEMGLLRRTFGEKLYLDIRIDDADLGHITVLSPDGADHYRVPCLSPDYAQSLSRYQHKICREFARNNKLKPSSEGWLEAKAEIGGIIETEILGKKRKSGKRLARFEGLHDAPASTEADSSSPAPPAIPAPDKEAGTAPSAETVNPPAETPLTLDQAAPARKYVPVIRERRPLPEDVEA